MKNDTESMEMEQMSNVSFEKTVSVFDLILSNSKGLYRYQWLESEKGVMESAKGVMESVFVKKSKQSPREFPWPQIC